MDSPISPPPVTEWKSDYLPAYLSNGLIGLRVGHIPLLYGVAMLSSFEGLDPETMVEASARVPYPLAGDVRIGQHALSDEGCAVLHEQRYDFSCGELLTRLSFETSEARADLQIITLCSRAHPSLALQEVSMVVDQDCEVTMSVIIDARGVPGEWGHDKLGDMDSDVWPDGPFSWHSLGSLSKCGIASHSHLLGSAEDEQTYGRAADRVTRNHTFQARRGQVYQLRKLVSVVPAALHSQPQMQAARLVKDGVQVGFETLRQDNRREWESLWRGRLILAGAPSRWQAMADAAYFYLHTSVHSSSPSSTSVFGLAYWPNYHYYRGHMMWDMDVFALPPLFLTHPDVALGLLRFRGTRLPAALANSSLTGYKGAQYPWESSLTTGHEAAPVGTRGPGTEHHVSMDVAIAFSRYVLATNDRRFALYEAMPVLSGVADWIESRVKKTERGFEIKRAIGIAETGRPVDNSAFVNMSACVALRETIALAKALDLPYKQHWEEIAEDMVIPIDTTARIIRNYDGYDAGEPKASTPDAPAGLFPLGYEADPETVRNTMEYFVHVARDYAGEPMLSAILGVYASWLGDRAASLELFERGYADFVVDPYSITLEYSPVAYPDHTRAGPFTANIGGFLTSCFYGLTGLKLARGDPNSWFYRDAVLPEGWDAIHVDRIWAHGNPMTLDAAHGERGTLTENAPNS